PKHSWERAPQPTLRSKVRREIGNRCRYTFATRNDIRIVWLAIEQHIAIRAGDVLIVDDAVMQPVIEADMRTDRVSGIFRHITRTGWNDIARQKIRRYGERKLRIVRSIKEESRIVEVIRIESRHAEERVRSIAGVIVHILMDEPHIRIIRVGLEVRNVGHECRRQYVADREL